MEQPLKHILAESLKGRTYNFKCSCILPIDDIGTIKDYEIVNNEILFIVDFHGKIVRIGENHPNMLLSPVP